MIYAARRRNESYPREKFEIDTHPGLIVLIEQQIPVSMCRSMLLLRVSDRRDKLDALNDEFECGCVDF